ncbi:hypothetical protein PMI14_02070 [Acidovorax sp. CF316]|uniref:DUF4262 domain-containing protein n=1 Tax=Acidovorax sp. CF316 TaxID=1144317 RepID=UPI00026BDE83|nr:DUF4262 domain-containing protein [Acidovorax sp. CF316]EJE53171.1 hypothetical protein PMI14_02070 [Acidovorax sp. CF316]
MEKFIKRVRKDIAAFGCSVIAVGDEDPPFAYTVGLWSRFKHPELILFGLPTELTADILNAIAAKIEAGAEFKVFSQLHDVGGKFGLHVKPLHGVHLDRYFGFGLRFHGQEFPIAQVVWPDRAGRFPEEPGHDRSYAALQPVLSGAPHVPDQDA